MRSRTLLAATAILLVLIAGCSAPEPEPALPLPEGPSVEELFGSEEDARLAAEQALRDYWSVRTSVFRSPADGVDQLEAFVTSERLVAEANTAELYADQDFAQVGDLTFDSVRFNRLDIETAKTYLIVTACADYSEYKLVNSSGATAKPKSDFDRYQHVVHLEVTQANGSSELRISDIKHRWEKPC